MEKPQISEKDGDAFVIVMVASFEDGETEILHRIMEILDQNVDCKIINNPPQEKMLAFKDMVIDPLSRNVLYNGKNIVLTACEFDILYLLAKRPGQIFTKEQIYELVWKEPYYNAKDSVISMIRRIRQKIEPDSRQPMYILTVWGVGYKFNGDLRK